MENPIKKIIRKVILKAGFNVLWCVPLSFIIFAVFLLGLNFFGDSDQISASVSNNRKSIEPIINSKNSQEKPLRNVGEDRNIPSIQLSPESIDKPVSILDKIQYPEQFYKNVKRLETYSTLDGTVIPLKMRAKLQCGLGDLDIIKQDLKLSNVKENLILTLEPLSKDDKSFSPVFTHTSIFEIISGISYKIKLQIKEPVHTGLFICNDSNKSRRCKDKLFQNISTLGKGFITNKEFNPEGVKTNNQDKVYYFAHLLVDTDNIQFISNSLTGDDYTTYATSLNQVFSNSQKIADNIESIKKFSELINSVPPQISSGSVIIDLPKMDPKLCVKTLR